jgi:hypothetical protein
MHKYLVSFFLVIHFCPTAQPLNPVLLERPNHRKPDPSANDIIADLQDINTTITNSPCSTGRGPLISNRAYNLFLLDKTSYLSHSDDLSFYTNYVTFNTAEGKLTVTHSFHDAKGKDALIKSFFNAGLAANVAQPFSTNYIDNTISKEVGVIINLTVIGKPATYFNRCSGDPSHLTHKQNMDVMRASILETLVTDIKAKAVAFEEGMAALPPQYNPTQKSYVRQQFYENLRQEYYKQFAEEQAEALTRTKNFKLITTSWTSFTIHAPFSSTKYFVTPSYSEKVQQKRSFLADAMLSHTRLWETNRYGRFFLTIKGSLRFNNSKDSHGMNKASIADYRSAGGVDADKLSNDNIGEVFIGDYKRFLTRTLSSRLVYFPNESHVGLTCLIERTFGKYNSTNIVAGVPIILINKKKLPACNFEFNLSLFDVSNKIISNKTVSQKASFALNLGIPFSRMIF